MKCHKMVFSHTAGRAALVHVLKEVFDLDDDDPLSKSLSEQHLTDIRDLMSYSFEQVQEFTYKDDTGASIPVPTHQLNLFRILQEYIVHRQTQGDPIGDDWTSITQEQFNEYRVSSDYLVTLQSGRQRSPIPSSTSTSFVPRL